jgi:hypothetical protein
VLAIAYCLMPIASARAEPPSPYQPPSYSDQHGPELDPKLVPTAYQPRPPSLESTSERDEIRSLLEMPGLERVFHVESEPALFERIRLDFAGRNQRVEFPKDPIVGEGKAYAGRFWEPRVTQVVPNLVIYTPLYFEEKNAERYGWDAGIFQPIISAGYFYADLLLFPYNLGAMPPWTHECSAGYFLPGDPVPYLIYLPPWSWCGTAMEAGAIVGYALLYM